MYKRQGNSAVRTLTFTKSIAGFVITLSAPLEADSQPTRANVKVTRDIPAGGTFKVEVTNNPFDASPVWEDCTNAVVQGVAHVFTNKINTAAQYGMNIRVTDVYKRQLVNRIQDKAVDIYECVLEANELDLRDAQEYRQRQKLQAKALTYCKELLFFIELSQEMGFISMSSCEYWSKLALEVKYMTTAWKKRDKTRA